jgi:glycerate-2-kinase
LICGASIHEINTVRKHLSNIKGGRLAQAAYPARTVSLLISDVPGDDPATIASGPTTGDPTTIDQAVAILAKYAIKLPKAVDTVLRAPASESPSPGHVQLNRSRLSIIATPAEALAAAGAHAQERGLTVINRGDAEEGIARELACVHSRLVIDSDQFSGTGPKTVMLSGGETTVVVKGQGTGGRNQEYLLALAIELNGMANIFAIACDTDGIDGASKVAGAIITPDTLSRARLLKMNPRTYLADNNAGAFFEALGDTVVTGPTRTNVNDFRAIVCFRDPS